MKKNQKKIILSILGIFLAILWANNTSLFADKSTQYNFLAHRRSEERRVGKECL